MIIFRVNDYLNHLVLMQGLFYYVHEYCLSLKKICRNKLKDTHHSVIENNHS